MDYFGPLLQIKAIKEEEIVSRTPATFIEGESLERLSDHDYNIGIYFDVKINKYSCKLFMCYIQPP
jgi:hypothetical protein